MRITKWIFFGYLLIVALVIVGIVGSFGLTPVRDPKTLYRAYGSNIKTLDPAEITDTESDAMGGSIYECLYNYKYGVEPYEIIPELAAGMPVVSNEGKTIRIRIRHGIHFYDPEKKIFPDGVGPEVTAKDVIYSWKRVCDFKLASPQYSGIFQDRIVGLDDWWAYTQNTPRDQVDWDRPVEGFQIINDNEIEIRLVTPYPQLRYNLAHTPTAVVCRQAVEYWKEKFRQHPVGTGPYFLAQHLKEQRLVLEANPIFRGKMDADGDVQIAAADKLPHIKRVQYDYYDEDLPVWMLFRQGLLDIGGIPKETYSTAINAQGALTPEMERDGIKLIKHTGPDTWYIGFNMSDPVVGRNKPLRQAMSMAYDRKTFIDIYLNGRGMPAIGPIPPGFPTFDARQVNPNTQFNLALAREKMKEAEQINGGPIPELTINFPSTDTSVRQMAEFLVSQMAAIGVKLKPQFNTWARFQEIVDSKQTQIFTLGWVADYPDEQTFFQLFYGKNAGANGINSTDYKSPEYDALYEKASIMEPGPERDDIYRKLSLIVMDDCPWIIQYYSVSFTLQYGWVKNLNDMDYGYGMRSYLELDSAERERWRKSH